MKRILFLLIAFLSYFAALSQYKVTFVLRETTPIKRDSVFITGTFNNWDSVANPKYKLTNGNGQRSIVMNLPAGDIRYKFIGGNWFKVEKNWSGDEIFDRLLTIRRDTIIVDTVVEWRDLFMKNKRQALSGEIHDTTRLIILGTIAQAFAFNSDWRNEDSSFVYIRQTLQLLDRIKSSDKLKSWPAYTNSIIGAQELYAALLHSMGNYAKSLELRLENFQLAHDTKTSYWEYYLSLAIADDYISMKDYANAWHYCKIGEALSPSLGKGSYTRNANIYYRKAVCAAALGPEDSALRYARQLYDLGSEFQVAQTLGASAQLLGDHFSRSNNPDSASYYYHTSIGYAIQSFTFHIVVRSEKGLANLFLQKGQVDSALVYGRAALRILYENHEQIQSWSENAQSYLADISPLVAEIFRRNRQPDSAYKYLQLSVQLKDSLYNIEKVRQFQNLTFNESLRHEEVVRKEKEAQQRMVTKIKIYGLVIGLAALLFVIFILYRNFKQKRQANIVLEKQKDQIERTLQELELTQAQLIQSAKMASLGELTAGIAHEIQNPLNFVNNFAEINKDLVEELRNERTNGGRNGDAENELLDTIFENESKIIHYGKRADNIVKGMLQHSRASTGQKEPTDINKLAEEYLRLAYHGFRSTEKGITITLKTDYDKDLHKILVIPQDIGRVLQNLYNNAFYALSISRNELPTLHVSTKKENDKVYISVKDNGTGIPENIVDKIFQPFFTTKPSGEGTGLGLSLSYDVIKSHGGELKVYTRPGEGTEFVIVLPA